MNLKNILTALLLIAAAAFIVLSVVRMKNLFSVFGSDIPPEQRQDALKKARNKLIVCYAAAAVLVTAAALIKLL